MRELPQNRYGKAMARVNIVQDLANRLYIKNHTPPNEVMEKIQAKADEILGEMGQTTERDIRDVTARLIKEYWNTPEMKGTTAEVAKSKTELASQNVWLKMAVEALPETLIVAKEEPYFNKSKELYFASASKNDPLLSALANNSILWDLAEKIDKEILSSHLTLQSFAKVMVDGRNDLLKALHQTTGKLEIGPDQFGKAVLVIVCLQKNALFPKCIKQLRDYLNTHEDQGILLPLGVVFNPYEGFIQTIHKN